MSLPIAIIDARSPRTALIKLKKQFIVHPFLSKGITYNAIAGHPDIFMFQDGEKLVVAPNIPKSTLNFFTTYNINFLYGNNPVGESLKESTFYNCVAGKHIFFHKNNFTDSVVFQMQNEKEFINIPQAYTRCSMFLIDDNTVITSDKGIEKHLQNRFTVLYINPKPIILPPYKHGFIGGCMGIYGNTLYVNGAVSFFKEEKMLLDLLQQKNMKLCELHTGAPYDGGGIFFL